ncbi:MAG TPA: tetratricopeptide repeat protein [Deltaproteobacteria bacterium]|nr:tetratricopeptide repeat protein [Deltaproteobacteria bacterium]
MTTNLIIALVVFGAFLLVLYLVSRRAAVHDPAAVEELRRSADIGDVYAQFRLGQLYYEGKSVPRSDADAAVWFLKAARQDHAEAQFILATMFEKGHGVTQSEEEAFRWYSCAAAGGHERARVILESAKWQPYRERDDMSGGVGVQTMLEKDQHGQPPASAATDPADLLGKYLEKASAGDVDAQYNLGVMYYHGEGVPVDHEEALRWFHRAAEQGDADAQYSLGCMYGRGEGTAKDHGTSVQWFKRAAQNGHAGAREILDRMYGKS